MRTERQFFIDITLQEICYLYLIKKKIKPTTGNLFTLMSRVCKKIDYINKNTHDKIINFTDGYCKFMEK